MKYHIVTFGCAANIADSERIAGWLEKKNYRQAKNIKDADYIVINTCMVRESAENRVYGLVNNLIKDSKTVRQLKHKKKIVLTGCMVGMAIRDKTGKFMQKIRKAMPEVHEFLPIEEIGFDNLPVRDNKIHAWVPISNGCNNFCTYCVVPYTRGREISRPVKEIIDEVRDLAKKGYSEITLIGQNVNSYGADLVRSYAKLSSRDPIQSGRGDLLIDLKKIASSQTSFSPRNDSKQQNKITYVKHLGRLRIPTLFPYLLNEVCKIRGIKKVDFISSNPWDFSDELINVIKKNTKITRQLHLPLQSGDNEILKKMNRWYTAEQYLALISKIKNEISLPRRLASCRSGQAVKITFSTDIIVGFPGETKSQFQNTVDLVKKIGFNKAYISQYSDRPETAAHKIMKDNVSHMEKKRRWKILDDLINQPNLKKGSYPLEKYRISVKRIVK